MSHHVCLAGAGHSRWHISVPFGGVYRNNWSSTQSKPMPLFPCFFPKYPHPVVLYPGTATSTTLTPGFPSAWGHAFPDVHFANPVGVFLPALSHDVPLEFDLYTVWRFGAIIASPVENDEPACWKRAHTMTSACLNACQHTWTLCIWFCTCTGLLNWSSNTAWWLPTHVEIDDGTGLQHHRSTAVSPRFGQI